MVQLAAKKENSLCSPQSQSSQEASALFGEPTEEEEEAAAAVMAHRPLVVSNLRFLP